MWKHFQLIRSLLSHANVSSSLSRYVLVAVVAWSYNTSGFICVKGQVEFLELPDPCLTAVSLWSQLDLVLKARLVVMVELHMEEYQPLGQTLIWVRALHMFVIQMHHANLSFPAMLMLGLRIWLERDCRLWEKERRLNKRIKSINKPNIIIKIR